MGGLRYDWHVRLAAVKALWWAKGNFPQAYDLFETAVPAASERPPRSALHSFMSYWEQQLLATGSVVSRPPPGQRPAMPDPVAADCISLLLGGYNVGRGRKYFSSVRDALKRSKRLQQLVEPYGYNHRSLLRRLKHLDHTLSRHTLRYIKKLKPTERSDRVAYCTKLLDKGEALSQYLARIVWLDAKKLFVVPKEHLVYAPHGATRKSVLLVEDERLPGSQFATKKISYYAAVNQVLGAVYIKVTSGTSELKRLAKENPALQLKLYKRKRDGRRARSTTAEEWRDYMQELQAKVLQRLEDPATAAAWAAATGGTPDTPPIFSFDNPSIHKNNLDYLRELGLVQQGSDKPTDAWLQLPTYSGDLHRTIERVHGRVCRAFQEMLNTESTARTLEFYIDRLFKLFKLQTSDLITACMKNLPELYEKVIELKGAKAPRPYC